MLLAHTRLAIIGLGDAGAQPAASTDGRLTLSYNGEIYNYRALASGLGGIPASSDTRVLCELLRKEGPKGLNRARGMYAAAAWDSNARTFMALRDPWGVKPLYVLRHPSGGVTVASELPVLLESADARGVDPVGLAHYLSHGHTGTCCTLFRNVIKVPPGTVMTWQREGLGWSESTHRIAIPSQQPCRPFAEAIADSVRAHLVADVEVGVFLSGGLDSTMLAAIASDLAPSVRSFTLAFPDHPEIDESAMAEANAAALGVKFNRVAVTGAQMRDAADVFLTVHGEPFGDAAVLPLTCLSEVAAQEVKVVLTGEGADEIFGGYGRYRVSARLDHSALRLNRTLMRRAAGRWSRRRTDRPRDRALEAILWGGGPRAHGALLGSDAGWLGAADLPWARDAGRLFDAEWLAVSSSESELEHARDYDERRWLPNVYLEKVDRATMASSLEARVPYLDSAVAATSRAMTSPPKASIRAELDRRLPGAALPEKKKGLAVPLGSVLMGTLGDAGRYELASDRSILARTLGTAWQQPLRARADRSATMALRVAMLGRWDQLFSDRCDTA